MMNLQLLSQEAAEVARSFFWQNIAERSGHSDVHREIGRLMVHCQEYCLAITRDVWVTPQDILDCLVKGLEVAEKRYRSLGQHIEADMLWFQRDNILTFMEENTDYYAGDLLHVIYQTFFRSSLEPTNLFND
jgi:hypothetical protein